jgi:hypothetical protein
LLFAIPSAHAAAVAIPTTTYEFSANCQDCAEKAGTTDYVVHGQLVLAASYVLGTTIDPSQFVSFTYDGSNLLPPLTIYNPMFPPPVPPVPNEFAGTLLPGGELPATLPGPPAAEIGLQLDSQAGVKVLILPNGEWSIGQPPGDFGDNAIFAVPEPSTWAMLLIGFAGLAYAGHRTARGRSRALAA